MLERFQFVTFDAGAEVMREGEVGETCYVITSGAAAVFKAGIGVVATFNAGKTFGEVRQALMMLFMCED